MSDIRSFLIILVFKHSLDFKGYIRYKNIFSRYKNILDLRYLTFGSTKKIFKNTTNKKNNIKIQEISK